MIVRKLSSGRSCAGALTYNEEKLYAGEAFLEDVRNIPSPSGWMIRHTFEQRESHPALLAQTRNLGFHMAFNPGPNDTITREQCVRCIHEIMDMLGYSEQPYAVFRHNDIEREHYHIVASRVKKNGRLVSDQFDGYAIRSAVKTLEQKYGFKLGDTHTAPEAVKPVRRFSEKAERGKQFAGVLMDTLMYDFRSFEEFSDIMRSHGVEARGALRRDGGYNLAVAGLDANDRRITHMCSLEKSFNIRGWDLVNETSERNRRIEPALDYSRLRASVILSHCFNAAGREDELRSLMRSCGLDIIITRDLRKQIERVSVIDPASHGIFSSYDLGISLETFREKARSGHLAPVPRIIASRRQLSVPASTRRALDEKAEGMCRRQGIEVPAPTAKTRKHTAPAPVRTAAGGKV